MNSNLNSKRRKKSLAAVLPQALLFKFMVFGPIFHRPPPFFKSGSAPASECWDIQTLATIDLILLRLGALLYCLITFLLNSHKLCDILTKKYIYTT